MSEEPAKTALVEDCLGDLGFRVRWKYDAFWADVDVFEIVAIDPADPAGTAAFTRKGALATPDHVSDIEQAEPYLSGYIKWDGCAELNQGCPHWCGPFFFKKHMALVEWLYRRAQQLMASGNYQPWDEFPADPAWQRQIGEM